MLALNRIFRRDYAALFPWADRRNGSADVDAHRGGQRERSIDARVFSTISWNSNELDND
eukprot:SAG31_NODE_6859_length_1868_cov_1.690786_2_plen_59_part_00